MDFIVAVEREISRKGLEGQEILLRLQYQYIYFKGEWNEERGGSFGDWRNISLIGEGARGSSLKQCVIQNGDGRQSLVHVARSHARNMRGLVLIGMPGIGKDFWGEVEKRVTGPYIDRSWSLDMKFRK